MRHCDAACPSSGQNSPRRPRTNARSGQWLASRLQPLRSVPGALAHRHQYTLFPVLVKVPLALIERLKERWFDAAMRGSLVVAPAHAEYDCQPAEVARHLLEHMAFLPFYDEIPDAALARMAGIICDASPANPPKPLLAEKPHDTTQH